MDPREYLPIAKDVSRRLPKVLEERGLTPAIDRFILTHSPRGVWLFAVMDVERLGKLERYTGIGVTHQISTALGGRQVVISNTSGLRYAILLSNAYDLPETVSAPEAREGRFQPGLGLEGPASVDWEDLGHVLTAGMTGSGKSNFLRLLADQAIADGLQIALSDPDGRTFGHFAGHAALFGPIGESLEGCQGLVDNVNKELVRRIQLFRKAPGVIDNLPDYNRAVSAREAIPRLILIIDEFSGLVNATGGRNAAFNRTVTNLAWRGRKFGLHLVLAGQDFSKEIVGAARDQLATRVCFQVASPSISRIVLGISGAELLKVPGRAITNRWGLLQIYRASPAQAEGDALTIDERELLHAIQTRFDGRMTYENLGELGYGRRQADRLRQDWQARGLAELRPDRDNALCVLEA
jgi:hypothetical protein